MFDAMGSNMRRCIRLTVSAIGVIGTLVWIGKNWPLPGGLLPTDPQAKSSLVILFALWTVLPPLWFLLEWAVLFKPTDNFEHFKYGQELARNLWIAIAALIGLLIGVGHVGGGGGHGG
jgi:hypothetical protein